MPNRTILIGARRGRMKPRIVPILSVLLGLSIVFIVIGEKLRPMVVDMAFSAVSDLVTVRVNEAVTQVLSSGEFDYEDLVRLEKDESGKITALVTDMKKINVLQAMMTNAIIDRIGDEEHTAVSMPLGNLFNGTLLSGRGPKIRFKLVSFTNVNTDFTNEFYSAGINQSRHQIMMNVEVRVTVLAQGRSASVPVNTEVVIAETVIMGSVPNVYTNTGE